METLTVFELLKKVILSWQVIAVTVALVLYLNLVFFISRRRKYSIKIRKISIGKKKAKAAEPDIIHESVKEDSDSNDELGLEEE